MNDPLSDFLNNLCTSMLSKAIDVAGITGHIQDRQAAFAASIAICCAVTGHKLANFETADSYFSAPTRLIGKVSRLCGITILLSAFAIEAGLISIVSISAYLAKQPILLSIISLVHAERIIPSILKGFFPAL